MSIRHKYKSKNRYWRWLLLALLTLLLSLSASLNVALWNRAKQYYKESNATRLDPLGINAFSPSEISPKGELTRVVFTGDSRASAWPAPTLEGYEFINRGIGAQTSTQVLQRFSAHVAPLNPDIIIIQVGINDIKTIGLFPNQTPKILSDARNNIAQLISQAEATGAQVIVSSILPAGEITLARRAFWSDDIDTAVVEVNKFLKEIATSNAEDNIVWFDSYAAIANNKGRMKSEYRQDELHLNNAGYKALNQRFTDKLISLTNL